MTDIMTEKEKQVHLTDYLRVVWRRWILVLLIWVVVVVTVAAVTFSQNPLYRLQARLLIEQRTMVPRIFGEGAGAIQDTTSREFIRTQFLLIRSREVAKKLYTSPALRMAEWPLFQNLRAGDPISIIQGWINLTPAGESHMVDVWVLWPDRKQGADMVNLITDAYIAIVRTQEQSVVKKTLDELTDRLKAVNDSIREADQKIAIHREAHKLYSTSESQQQLLGHHAGLIKGVQEASQKMFEAQQAVDVAQVMRSGGELLFKEESGELLTALRLKRHNYGESLALNRLNKTAWERERDQSDKQLSMLIAEVDRAIAVEIERRQEAQWAQLTAELAAARANYDRLYNDLIGLEPSVRSFQTRLFELESMQKQELVLQEIAEALRRALEQIDLNRILQETSARVVEPAEAPPENAYYTPRYGLNLGMGVFVGLFVGIGAAYFAEYLNTTIRLPRDIEETLGLRLLGFVPAMSASTKGLPSRGMLSHLDSRSGIAEAYRGIRTELLLSCPGTQACKTYMITSTSPQEGKTTVACNLAITMAQAGNRVLLIDADLRKPVIHQVFGLENEHGLSTLLSETAEARVYIKKTVVDNLHVLPGGPVPVNPAELLGSRKMRTLVAEAAERYDIVILDSSPVLGIADANIVATMADSVLLVIQASRVRRGLVLRARNLLSSVNARLAGAVLNNVRGSRGDYYYYRRYYSPAHAQTELQEQPVG